MTAQTLDGELVAAAIKADLVERIAGAGRSGHHPRPGHDPGGRRRAVGQLRGHEAPRLRRAGHRARGASTCRRRPPWPTSLAVVDDYNADPGRRRGAHPVPVPAGHRLRDGPHAPRPGQGRRRAPPGQPGPPGHGRRGPGGVHAGGHPGPAGALRHPHRRPSRGHRGPGPHHRPAAGQPADPQAPRGQRRGHRGAHRRGRPRAPTPARPTSWSRRPALPGSSPPTWSSPAPWWSGPACATRVARCCPTWSTRWPRWPSWMSPRLGGVGPMTRALLYRNTVEAAERSAYPDRP